MIHGSASHILIAERGSSFCPRELTDYSHVASWVLRYKPANFEAEKNPGEADYLIPNRQRVDMPGFGSTPACHRISMVEL